jgi:hypothetical protein
MSGGAQALAADHAGTAAQCARVVNDDTVRPYDPALKSQLAAAFQHLFPQAPAPDVAMLRAQSHLRCMDGHLMACFTGANLPCGKLSATRDNPGADAFCKSDPNAAIVPAYATGHDSAFSYRCRSGRAEVTGSTFPVDARGFAKPLWTRID